MLAELIAQRSVQLFFNVVDANRSRHIDALGVDALFAEDSV